MHMQTAAPLYDHPEYSDSLGRRRRLSRKGIDPDQSVTVTSLRDTHEAAARKPEPEVAS